MELRRPVRTGTTSQAGDDLQHEVAMRVQARLDREEQMRKRVERAKTASSLLKLAALVVVLLLGLWAWQRGLLDSLLGRKDPPRQEVQADLSGAGAQKASGGAEAQEGVAVSRKESVRPPVQEEGRSAVDTPPAVSPLARFKDATVDYWKNAVPEDRPAKNRTLTFTALVPDGGNAPILFEVEMKGGRISAVNRFTADGRSEPSGKDAFDKLTAKTPYLVVREGRAYFCSAGQGPGPGSYKVPAKGTAFDPSRKEFGGLADCLAVAGTKRPSMKYQVELVLENLGKALPVATVGYGESVPREAFEKAVRALVADDEMCKSLLSAGKVRVTAVK